jgi:hypothetical protein
VSRGQRNGSPRPYFRFSRHDCEPLILSFSIRSVQAIGFHRTSEYSVIVISARFVPFRVPDYSAVHSATSLSVKKFPQRSRPFSCSAVSRARKEEHDLLACTVCRSESTIVWSRRIGSPPSSVFKIKSSK